jgi:hypothetical protein
MMGRPKPRSIQSWLRHGAKFGALSFSIGVQCPTKKTAKAGVSLPALVLNRFGDRLEGELDP